MKNLSPFKWVLDYLEELTPAKAFLHTITLLSLAVIVRFGFGDFGYVDTGINRIIERHRVNRTYQRLKEKVFNNFLDVLQKWDGEFIAFFYYHDYYPLAVRFNALTKSYGFIVPAIGAIDPSGDRAAEYLTDLPVLYNEQLLAQLRDECHYTRDTGDFYLRDVATILEVKEFISYPLTNREGTLVAYISLAFTEDREFSDEQVESICTDLRTIAKETENTSEFVELFGLIKR